MIFYRRIPIFASRALVFMGVLLLNVLPLVAPQNAWAKKAGVGEVCEENKDVLLSPKRILVLNLMPKENAESNLAMAFSEDLRLAGSEIDHAVLLSFEGAQDSGARELNTCQKSDCLSEIAEVTEVDFIVYGVLHKERLPKGLGWRAEIRLFDAGKGRPIGKFIAKNTEPALLGVKLRDEMASFIPKPAPLKVVDCGPPDLVERPLFILGSAMAFTGTVFTLSSLAWGIDLNTKLSQPELHRGLKTEALTYRSYVLPAIGLSTAILVSGAITLGAGILILPDESDEKSAGVSE